ncbi:MAG: hypothetical protein HY262_05055 [Chloroflexi bacterium]|nr:hypothetical protein [Chloroflexota bacterium]
MNESIDAPDPTLANLRGYSSDVVEATIVAAGQPFWNSPTGVAPTTSDKPGPGNEFGIVTPYTITISQAVAGSRPVSNITVLIEGGTVGCYVHTVSPAVILTPKDSDILFLRPLQMRSKTSDPAMAVVFQAFPVVSGKVRTPFDGEILLSDFPGRLLGARPSAIP